jgi:hypothetical protein
VFGASLYAMTHVPCVHRHVLWVLIRTCLVLIGTCYVLICTCYDFIRTCLVLMGTCYALIRTCHDTCHALIRTCHGELCVACSAGELAALSAGGWVCLCNSTCCVCFFVCHTHGLPPSNFLSERFDAPHVLSRSLKIMTDDNHSRWCRPYHNTHIYTHNVSSYDTFNIINRHAHRHTRTHARTHACIRWPPKV